MREAAKQYVALAVELGFAPCATWIVLTENGETPESRKTGLECCKAEVAQCDELWLCGPVRSNGMTLELDAFLERATLGQRTRNFVGLTPDKIRAYFKEREECWV